MMDATYIRIAGVTLKVEPYMIKELQLEGTNTGFDAMQVIGDAVSQQEIDALCDRMHQHASASFPEKSYNKSACFLENPMIEYFHRENQLDANLRY